MQKPGDEPGFPALLNLLFHPLSRDPVCDQFAEPLRAFLLPLAKLADSQITEIGFLAPVNGSGRTMPGFPAAAPVLFPLNICKLWQLIPATGTFLPIPATGTFPLKVRFP